MGRSNDRNEYVLIVDDDEVMGELLIALMTMEGYRVSHAASAEAALQRVSTGEARPDVVLCDVQMPGMRGGDLAEALSGARDEGMLPRTTLLLGMSGSAPEEQERRYFDGFISKPFTMEEFAETVEQIRAHGARKEIGSSAANGDGTDVSGGRSPLAEKTFGQLRSKLGDGQLHELYRMTLDDVEERLGKIAAAAAAGDTATVKREAHTIKGSCGMVGAVELQELAAATEGGSAVDTCALEKFDRACNRLRRMLKERL